MISIKCEACGKKLMERLPNGLFKFQFGAREGSIPVIDMEIQGSIRMRCPRRSCKHINFIHYFPQAVEK